MAEDERKSHQKTASAANHGQSIIVLLTVARSKPDCPEFPYVFAFHDGEEIGPRMLSRIAKNTGLQPGDL